ncbi:hypothetical protein, partial [Streptomonospora salina]
FINVLGNAVATIVIGKREKDFDIDRANTVLRAGAAELEHIEAEHDAAENRPVATLPQCLLNQDEGRFAGMWKTYRRIAPQQRLR